MASALRKATVSLRPTLLGAQRSFSTALKVQDDLYINPGGRQSVSGITATVFGGNGFVGRYVVNRLGKIGSQCVVPFRGDGMNARHLKLMGDLGQIVPLPLDFTDEESIRTACDRSNVVINLIGNQHKTANYSYHDTNVKCTYRLAKIAAESGNVKKFIHLSCIGAAHDSPSEQLRTKAEGEDVIREFFPRATIIRSAPIFGCEDNFLNRYASLANFTPVFPVLEGGKNWIQPVYVQDVAQLIVNSLVSAKAPGALVEACGPEQYTEENIIQYVAQEIYRRDVAAVPFPAFAAELIGKAADKLLPGTWRLINEDMVDQQKVDLVESGTPGVLGFSDFDIKPRKLEQEASTVLMRHRGTRVRERQSRNIGHGAAPTGA